MSEHKATIRWQRSEGDFLRGKFSREHSWTFDGGAVVAASAAPSVVPVPFSSAAAVDPEEALVASVSSCHMLTFLYVASKGGFQVDSYEDEAVGIMTKNEKGIPWISAVNLNPKITYGGDKQPTSDEVAHLHHKAHELCFIANSVKSEITVATG
jgi:organic hydroperoxide reductase OsmC/OhrA